MDLVKSGNVGQALRLVVELVIFAAGVAALVARERIQLAILLAVLYLIIGF